jgi:hypothetical protein
VTALTSDLEKRLERLPQDLQHEFPDVPVDTIQRSVGAGARALIATA